MECRIGATFCRRVSQRGYGQLKRSVFHVSLGRSRVFSMASPHLCITTLVVLTWTLGVYANYDLQEQPKDDLEKGVCQRKYLRNSVDALKRLEKCRVIEGSLQISLIEETNPEHYLNLTFPELREITGYFLLWEANGLTTLQNLFPNLAVIRGQELVHNYALIVSSMQQMQDVGLPSLTNIQKGDVWIVENPNLCYVDTVDWARILNVTNGDEKVMLMKNKPAEQCPNMCPSTCPQSDSDKQQYLCWNNTLCQKVAAKDCPRCSNGSCMPNGQCCNSECLGGCSGPGSADCFVCKNVVYNNICMEKCPIGYYEYLKRRCVSESECRSIVAMADPNREHKGPLRGKLYNETGKLMCVLECPKNTELSADGTECQGCDGPCKKICNGLVVDSIERARLLAGCTRIKGGLRIQLRGKGKLFQDLRENLDKIEEIDDYLVITYTYSIYSLDFLENLRRINGNVLEGGYALMVKSNENLVELWTGINSGRRITIGNEKARVLFHYNPKLCPAKIWNFVKQAGIPLPKDDKIDIGITNGDKVSCNMQLLKLNITQRFNSSVELQWENFRLQLNVPEHLLNYEVAYKEAPEYPHKNVSIFDDRDPCGDDDWKVRDVAKLDMRYGASPEPEWEDHVLITELKHYTMYAVYVKTIVIPAEESSPNNDMGAMSEVKYFRTLPDIPTIVRNVQLSAEEPYSISIKWDPPAAANGELVHYNIYIKEEKEDQSRQDQRDFCRSGRYVSKVSGKPTTSGPSLSGLLTTASNGEDCCSCSASGQPDDKGKRIEINHHDILIINDVQNAIMNSVFIPNPNWEAPVDNPQDNEIRTGRQRRKRDMTPIDSVPDSEEKNGGDIVFPGDKFPYEYDIRQQMSLGMELVTMVPHNSTTLHYNYMLRNLTHYTTYTIAVQACRQNTTDIKNDTRTCSNFEKHTIQTALAPTADNIESKSIHVNVTEGNKLRLRWNEPVSPNGVIMAYNIKIQKVDASGKTLEAPFTPCVTRKTFHDDGGNFTYDQKLNPGNYSVRVQVVSLAQESEFSAEMYFYIEDLDKPSPGYWVLVILVPLMVIILLIGALFMYYIHVKGPWDIVHGRRVISANPEYMENVDIPPEWEVPREKIELRNELGFGSFGMVFDGILKDFIAGHAIMRCAVKTVSDDATSDDRRLFLKEAALMTQLNCHHVVKLLGVVSKTQPTFVIMELMMHGDLKKYLRERRPDSSKNCGDPPPTLKQILRIATEIADGMCYIHSHKLVHRDLAARNCMVAEDHSVKVGDFGMTKEVVQTDYYRKQTKGLLPVRWMAPESIHDGVFTNHSDVWSFGVVLWEMATLAAQPYKGLSNNQVLQYVQSGGIMERPENCPDILYDLMIRCWQFHPGTRPTFLDILDWLTPDIDKNFAQVSFYNSREGAEYKQQLDSQPKPEDLITVRTPLRATFDTLSDDDLDDYDLDDNKQQHLIIDDLRNTPTRQRLVASVTNTTADSHSQPTTTSTSLANGLALSPLTIPMNVSSNLITNNNHPPTTLPLQTIVPTTNSNNNYTSAVNSSGTVSGGFVTLDLSSNCISASSSTTPNGVENIGNSKTLTGSQSSGQIHNPKSGNGSNDSSKAFSITYSSDGSKLSNGGGSVSTGGGVPPGTGSTGGNGYITVRHSPAGDNYSKNRTTQF